MTIRATNVTSAVKHENEETKAEVGAFGRVISVVGLNIFVFIKSIISAAQITLCAALAMI